MFHNFQRRVTLAFKRAKCRIMTPDHLIGCEIKVLPAARVQEHVHFCLNCETILFRNITPVSSDVESLLRDMGYLFGNPMGLSIPDQQDLMN